MIIDARLPTSIQNDCCQTFAADVQLTRSPASWVPDMKSESTNCSQSQYPSTEDKGIGLVSKVVAFTNYEEEEEALLFRDARLSGGKLVTRIRQLIVTCEVVSIERPPALDALYEIRID